jgi:hypothetical protein
LKSGKSLHENIAQQFLNSVFCCASRKENEDDNIYVLKERFSGKLRSRSRSKSRSKSRERNRDNNRERSRSDSRQRRNKKSRYDESTTYSRSGKYLHKP